MNTPAPTSKMRADKWLWHARFFKTRSLATKLVAAGHLRVNGQKLTKPASQITPGDVMTFPQANQVRVVQITALSTRRGPASEAALLYADLNLPTDEEQCPEISVSAPKSDRKGRPTKKDRRKLDQSRAIYYDEALD